VKQFKGRRLTGGLTLYIRESCLRYLVTWFSVFNKHTTKSAIVPLTGCKVGNGRVEMN